MVQQNAELDPARAATDEADGEDFDLEKVKEWAGFVVRAARRRRILAVTTFLTVAAFGLLLAAALPRTYNSQVRILAQRSAAIRVLSGSNQEMNRVDEPTKNVASMIMRRDNLTSLVTQAHLADRFEEARSPIMRLKDRFTTWLNGPPSDEDKLRVMVSFLEQRLGVYTDEGEATLVISVDWPSPQMAYDLVTLLQKNFLEARYDNDLALITDSISVLQEHAKGELASVDASLAEYQHALAATTPTTTADHPAARVPPDALRGPGGGSNADAKNAPAALPDPAVTLALEETRLRVHALEQERQRLLDSLTQQLSQAQLTLTPMHPTVMALQQRIDAMSQPSPELIQLKSEERALMAQVAQLGAADGAPEKRASRGPWYEGPAPATVRRVEVEDGPTRVARSKLEAAVQGYESAMARIDAANIELDITRAAYKYRYTVLTPAELPNRPKKPLGQLIGVGSVFAAALLAFIVAAVADLAGGVILEPWQVRRRLKLELIGQLDPPP